MQWQMDAISEELTFVDNLLGMLPSTGFKSFIVHVHFNDMDHMREPPASVYDGVEGIIIKYIPDKSNTISPNW